MDFKKFSNLIMIEQTLFALPFAYIGLLFAGGGADAATWIFVTTALASARTSGMLFNRLLDAEIDAANPRTASRLLPAGLVTKKSVWLTAVFSSLIFIASSYALNDLCFYLSFPALILLFTYSLFKRFSASSHFYLGFVEAAAPIGGFLAVTGEFAFAAFIPAAAIMFWIAGLDILYAIQDMNFDKEKGLHSVPVSLGVNGSLYVSSLSYIISLTSLAYGGILLQAGFFYYYGLAVTAVIFFFQQEAVRKNADFQKSILEVFALNRYVSPVIFIGLLLDRIL
jgi:4-hydroxybenzoate polyprenyltransferase